MNREILFRGKRIDNGEWVEGFYVRRTDDCLLDSGKHYIVNCDAYGFSWYEVDPDTVGEYTGFSDKNGKKIFEGDILKSFRGDVLSVTHRTTYFLMQRKNGRASTWLLANHNEVIGNIHDNHELLEV